MTDPTPRRHAEDLERQVEVLQGDIATLARLMKEIGESAAGETRDKALAEAADLLDRSRKAVEQGRRRAREKAATIEDYIHDKPVQSTLIALGVGLLVGLMTRR
jgi:ElaB/YqjD/DUF883 family membrane-anchored ribosome-binding protein